tara:strand:- start:370 stop:840 length:471 start_codon:yes stop_codon:yes gene_type:complete
MNPDLKIKYEIAGNGPFYKKIVSLISKLNMDDHIKLKGHIKHKDIKKFMKNIDVYINLPQRESFGVAVLEASASGTPVIASNVGGLPEVVVNGKTGYIVDPKDEDQVIKIMNYFIEGAVNIHEMGINGKKFISDNYSWNESARYINSLYKDLIRNE